MSDGSVRSAIKTYMGAANIDGISKWYLDEPWYVAGGQWPAAIAGSIAYVHIDDTRETRLTMGGLVGTMPGGQKMALHMVSLVIAYRYRIPTTTTEEISEDAWVAPMDTQIEAVKARIRADPTFGCAAAGPIWQAGQDLDGTPSIHQVRDLPVTDPKRTQVLCWNRIEIPVAEIITA